jgi:glutathione S-transferase
MLQLHNFFRSGTSHRLRIALNLKGLDYDYIAVHLGKEAHLSAAYKALNPQGLVPKLVDGDQVLTQTPAIIEWLEERHPTPPLLAADAQRGDFCFGNTPTLADVYLVPQVESARRFKVDLSPYPSIVAIERACARLQSFQNAAPANQPDAQ